jgi:hypothetical protein
VISWNKFTLFVAGQGKSLKVDNGGAVNILLATLGIGLPAVDASGMITANSLASVDQHLKMLREIGIGW